MSPNNLKAINEKCIQTLKICEGLLWHLRLDHASDHTFGWQKAFSQN